MSSNIVFVLLSQDLLSKALLSKALLSKALLLGAVVPQQILTIQEGVCCFFFCFPFNINIKWPYTGKGFVILSFSYKVTFNYK